MTSRPPRAVARRPTIVAYSGGGHERLMPLLATLAAGVQENRLQSAVDGRANDQNGQEQPEVIEDDEESGEWNSSDEYDTDLEQIPDTNNNKDGLPSSGVSAAESGSDATRSNARRKRRSARSAVAGHPSGDEVMTPGERVDCGEAAYGDACDRLGITQVQRIVAGLSTPAINLKYRSLGPRGAKALAAALSGNSNVETLDIEENGLGGEGAVYIAEMLRENSSITAVNMAKNYIGSEGAMAFGELLQFNNEIQYLDLSENNFRDVDAEPLACGIEHNERIIYLNLSNNEFSEDGAVPLGRAIGTNNSIERLDVSWNRMRRKGAVMICTGLKRNYCVTSVNLSWNGFDYEGALAVGEMLRGNKYLREVDISNNRINWEGAILIAKGLKENDTLELFYMGGNPLTMTGVLDILEAVDNSTSVVSYIGFDGIPVNRKIMYMMESIQKHREFTMTHGGLLESEDLLGRRMVLRCDPLKLLVQFLTDKNIRPVDLFRTFDKDKQFRVTREQFIQGLKKAKVPLDDYEIEKVLFRLDTGKEGKISYQRLMKGVKEQLRMNRAEEKQRMLEEKNTNDENRKLMKMAGIATGPGHVSFAGSNHSSPRMVQGSLPSDDDLDDDDDDGGLGLTGRDDEISVNRPSNLTRANVQAHQQMNGGRAVAHLQQMQAISSLNQAKHPGGGGGSGGGGGGGGALAGNHVGAASKSSLATASKASMSAAGGDGVDQHQQSGAGTGDRIRDGQRGHQPEAAKPPQQLKISIPGMNDSRLAEEENAEHEPEHGSEAAGAEKQEVEGEQSKGAGGRKEKGGNKKQGSTSTTAASKTTNGSTKANKK